MEKLTVPTEPIPLTYTVHALRRAEERGIDRLPESLNPKKWKLVETRPGGGAVHLVYQRPYSVRELVVDSKHGRHQRRSKKAFLNLVAVWTGRELRVKTVYLDYSCRWARVF